MSVALQIRDVPEEVRDALASAAAERGQSLQAYLLEMIRREVRIRRNVDIIYSTADVRLEIPPELAPERLIREGRDRGFDVDRTQ